jgi:hypothetical protein
MMMMFTEDTDTLGEVALRCLLAQQTVNMVLPDKWERPRNFPLPIKADKASPVRSYRPLAILEWINDELSGANKAAEMKARASKQKETA